MVSENIVPVVPHIVFSLFFLSTYSHYLGSVTTADDDVELLYQL